MHEKNEIKEERESATHLRRALQPSWKMERWERERFGWERVWREREMWRRRRKTKKKKDGAAGFLKLKPQTTGRSRQWRRQPNNAKRHVVRYKSASPHANDRTHARTTVIPNDTSFVSGSNDTSFRSDIERLHSSSKRHVASSL